jgi:hypothetical protein
MKEDKVKLVFDWSYWTMEGVLATLLVLIEALWTTGTPVLITIAALYYGNGYLMLLVALPMFIRLKVVKIIEVPTKDVQEIEDPKDL